MVKIVNYVERKTDDGKKFFILLLEGKPEMKKSQTTGNFYISVKKATIPATFGEETCKSMIGQEIAGSIVKIEVEPYEYANPETGEVSVLTSKYVYCPVEDNAENPESFRELVAEGIVSI